MKLVIQIPCLNEEKTLPITLADIPKKIDGIDEIEILVIDDGSTDKTAEVAKSCGANYIKLHQRKGLAGAFRAGLEKSLELGADIIVNTDADNQYKGQDIPLLIKPIIEKKADMVIGSRNIDTIEHFSWVKKMLQKIGSLVVRRFSSTDIPDTTSGFRAYSREAALRLNIFSTYTYTLETIIQAGRQGMVIESIDIKTNDKLRESRLITSIPNYLLKSTVTILRIYLMYEPLRSFLKISLLPFSIGAIFVLRFLIFHFTQPVGGHIQSLILAAILIISSLFIITIGLLGDVLSATRKLDEEILYRLKKNSYGKK